VLKSSAGAGLSAIFAEPAGARLALNEIAEIRSSLLERLFPVAGVTRFIAAHIHDHLDRVVQVLLNPPFSAAAHLNGRRDDPRADGGSASPPGGSLRGPQKHRRTSSGLAARS
jgi:predicted RNA methylase